MNAVWHKRLGNLLCIKSIVTLALTGGFVFLAVSGRMESQDFLNIFSIVVAFYFGTQSERYNAKDNNEMNRNSTP